MHFGPDEDEIGAIVGIATSSFHNVGIMYFLVHLPTGAIFAINLGFVYIINQTEGEIDTSKEERENNIIDS